MKRTLTMLAAAAAFAAATAIADSAAVKPRAHENIEWSRSYAYHLTDGNKSLPRVLLVGDSIVAGSSARRPAPRCARSSKER